MAKTFHLLQAWHQTRDPSINVNTCYYTVLVYGHIQAVGVADSILNADNTKKSGNAGIKLLCALPGTRKLRYTEFH